MKITLWELNEGYQALVRLAGKELPKEQHKLAYKLSRIMKSAKSEIEDLGDSLRDLMAKYGFKPGEEIDPETMDAYGQQSKKFMKTTTCEIWGDPFKFSELSQYVAISSLDLANLDWLIIEDEETQEPKTQAQAAASK